MKQVVRAELRLVAGTTGEGCGPRSASAVAAGRFFSHEGRVCRCTSAASRADGTIACLDEGSGESSILKPDVEVDVLAAEWTLVRRDF